MFCRRDDRAALCLACAFVFAAAAEMLQTHQLRETAGFTVSVQKLEIARLSCTQPCTGSVSAALARLSPQLVIAAAEAIVATA